MSDQFGQGFEPGVGALLRASRLRFGQDLREVADLLRIRYPYLEAIEESRFGDLPGLAYAVGFVRTYAEYLGLDADEVVRRFKSETENMNRKTELVFPSPVAEQGTPSAAIVLVGLLVAGVAYGAWYLGTSNDGFLQELVSPVPEQLASKLPRTEDPAAGEADPTSTGATDLTSTGRVDSLATPAQAATGPESLEPYGAEAGLSPIFSAQPEPAERQSDEPLAAPDAGVLAPDQPPVVEEQAAPTGMPPITAPPREDANTVHAAIPADLSEPADQVSSLGRLSIPSAPVDSPSAAPRIAEIPSAPAVEETGSEADRLEASLEAPAVARNAETHAGQDSVPDAPGIQSPSVVGTSPAERISPRSEEPVSRLPNERPETVAEAAPPSPPLYITAEATAGSTQDAVVSGMRIRSDAVISASSAEVVTARATDFGEQSTLVEASPARSAEPIAAIPLAPEIEEVDHERVGRVYGSASGTSRVEVRAKTDSWIQVRDSESQRLLLTRLLRAGDSYLVPDRGGLTLLTGNAGALEIYVDGEPVAPIGPIGAVRRNVSLEAKRLQEGTAVLD